MKVEIRRKVCGGNHVGVYGDNILKILLRSLRSRQFDGMRSLAGVNAIKDSTVVHEKINSKAAIPRETCKRDVVTEDFHLADALAWAARDVDAKPIAGFIDVYHEAPRYFVKSLGTVGEHSKRFGPEWPPLEHLL